MRACGAFEQATRSFRRQGLRFYSSIHLASWPNAIFKLSSHCGLLDSRVAKGSATALE